MSRQRMSRVLAFGTVVSLCAFPGAARAQGHTFEGIVSFRGDQGRDMQYYIGHGRMRVDMSSDRGQGSMIMDPSTHVMYMVVPAQQMYMEMKMPNVTDSTLEEHVAHAKVTKTGKSETVAGHRCEYWHIENTEDHTSSDVCMASDLGNFMMFTNPMRRSAPPAWQRVFGSGDHFPLKVIEHSDGHDKTVLEVTKIEPKSLDASLFSPPASYHKMEMGMPMGAHH